MAEESGVVGASVNSPWLFTFGNLIIWVAADHLGSGELGDPSSERSYPPRLW